MDSGLPVGLNDLKRCCSATAIAGESGQVTECTSRRSGDIVAHPGKAHIAPQYGFPSRRIRHQCLAIRHTTVSGLNVTQQIRLAFRQLLWRFSHQALQADFTPAPGDRAVHLDRLSGNAALGTSLRPMSYIR